MGKRIGLLTSGGDCAGLNAVIRAVVRRAHHGYDWNVVGIHKGTHGLLARPVEVEELRPEDDDAALLRLGGTILGTTNRGDPFAFPMPDGSVKDRSAEIIEGFRALDLDALIGVGGDGSLAILSRLAAQGGIPFVGIPKTIDNDVARTERAVGFTTAVATATEALDRLQPTAASHDRVMVLELMGRDAGHIAIAAGIAGGADVVLIPEIAWTLETVGRHVKDMRVAGRNFALVVVAEAARPAGVDAAAVKAAGGIGHWLADRLDDLTGAETRVTVLGHVQRGGTPTAEDRLLGSALGVHAVDLVAQGRTGRMVAWWNRDVIDVPLEEVVAVPHVVDPLGPLVRTARGLDICLGDAG
ncbi:MAG: ATP-dependent 6-phosphofructokinase [Rhodospirillales bacterium]|nr:ATP-dependent 6-phosphofructokinase [Rhodospirillales bacterium]QQS11043.1 MAG: ATP-dependent 6-phosphofructokinase [Rhodospirillales bacterium]